MKESMSELIENVESVLEYHAVCRTFLYIVPEFHINCYYLQHFRGLFHFSVTKSEFKKFSAVNLKYEVREKGSYKRSTRILKAICVNISFAQ